MESISELFELFGTPPEDVPKLAQAIGEKRDTVYRWRLRGRIPETSWPAVISAARALGHEVTADMLLEANTPAGRRGRPPRAAVAAG